MIHQRTPSRSQYFSWINNTNEGATEQQTLINLNFFRFLRREYGMELDIYAFDAGALDGKRFYGSMKSERFKRRFPQGFGPLAAYARESGTRLGLWGGPDGFGEDAEVAGERIETMVSLCRDWNFALFKFDAVCGELPPENDSHFDEMMTRCRNYAPDLILLNHRLRLREGIRHATTSLWGGSETYIDVFSSNDRTAPHHRAGAMARGLTADNRRLIEDHGVCLSSCMDGWADDLILQAFGRSLILAPEIYGNPWLLADGEYPRLARIFNLHRKYRDIMVDAMTLPEKIYGSDAVSRGDAAGRIVVLRNLTWDTAAVTITLDESIGLGQAESIELRRFFPFEYCHGTHLYGASVEVALPPFSASVFYAGSEPCDEPGIDGVPFEVIRNVPGRPVEIDRLEVASTRANGRKVADFMRIQPPPEAAAFYEATVFSADSNALEVRSLRRAGAGAIPEVTRAREAFFNQTMFRRRGCCDANLFDGCKETDFRISQRFGRSAALPGAAFRLDLGEVLDVDEIVFDTGDEFGLEPLLAEEGCPAFVSEDLFTWRKVIFHAGVRSVIPVHGAMRYLKIAPQPLRMVSLQVMRHGAALNPDRFRASNLFADQFPVRFAWSATCRLDEILPGSMLAICINGHHGAEKVYAAALIDGHTPLGCPDRAPSYRSNTWEYLVKDADENYTCYLPLKEEYLNRQLEVFVLDTNEKIENYQLELRMFTADPWRRERVICDGKDAE